MKPKRVWFNKTINTYFCSVEQPPPNVTDWVDISNNIPLLTKAERKFREDLNYPNSNLCRSYINRIEKLPD